MDWTWVCGICLGDCLGFSFNKGSSLSETDLVIILEIFFVVASLWSPFGFWSWSLLIGGCGFICADVFFFNKGVVETFVVFLISTVEISETNSPPFDLPYLLL